MRTPELSIIIPVYNAEKYLDRCIESVLAQTHTDWEMILVDDGSTDSSGIICDRYAASDGRITAIHTPNGGQSRARNLALDIAKGKYITFIDADDYLGEDYTHDEAIEVLDKNPETDIVTYPHISTDLESGREVYDRMNIFDEKPSPVTADDKKMLIRHLGVINSIQPFYIVSTPWAKIFRSRLWERNRFPEGMIFEDAYVLCDIIKEVRGVAFTNIGSYHYVNNPTSSLHQKKTPERFYFRIKLLMHFNETLWELAGGDCVANIVYYLVQGKRQWGKELELNQIFNAVDRFIAENKIDLIGKSGKLHKLIGTKRLVALKSLISKLKHEMPVLDDF